MVNVNQTQLRPSPLGNAVLVIDLARHADPTKLSLNPLHGGTDAQRNLLANIGAALRQRQPTAQHFKERAYWGRLLRCRCDRIAPVIAPLPASHGFW
ncbi:MAG: hypothetical protein QE285_07210 [Aquabacterium sp.]|nr:hypothetical protein [Aquabacterium sp.]